MEETLAANANGAVHHGIAPHGGAYEGDVNPYIAHGQADDDDAR
jgi:hypothetical protein